MTARPIGLADPAVPITAVPPPGDGRTPPTVPFVASPLVLGNTLNGIYPLTALATYAAHTLIPLPADVSLATVNGEYYIFANSKLTLGPGPLAGMSVTVPMPAKPFIVADPAV